MGNARGPCAQPVLFLPPTLPTIKLPLILTRTISQVLLLVTAKLPSLTGRPGPGESGFRSAYFQSLLSAPGTWGTGPGLGVYSDLCTQKSAKCTVLTPPPHLDCQAKEPCRSFINMMTKGQN